MPSSGGISLLESADADDKEDSGDCREHGEPRDPREPGDQRAGEFLHEYSSGTLLILRQWQSESKKVKEL
jgi:hypothetical protein